jgi:P27 family predicted phage terminase small subunit
MGLRGPPKKPTIIKVMAGNPGHQKLNKREPAPRAMKRAAPPKKVRDNPAALKHWKRLVPILLASRVLTEMDYDALANLCFDSGLLEAASEKLATTPLLVQIKPGIVRQNPLLAVVHDLSARVARSLREFGMTPAARASVHVASDLDISDPWADL